VAINRNHQMAFPSKKGMQKRRNGSKLRVKKGSEQSRPRGTSQEWGKNCSSSGQGFRPTQRKSPKKKVQKDGKQGGAKGECRETCPCWGKKKKNNVKAELSGGEGSPERHTKRAKSGGKEGRGQMERG